MTKIKILSQTQIINKKFNQNDKKINQNDKILTKMTKYEARQK